jgi:hypothetical protein
LAGGQLRQQGLPDEVMAELERRRVRRGDETGRGRRADRLEHGSRTRLRQHRGLGDRHRPAEDGADREQPGRRWTELPQ